MDWNDLFTVVAVISREIDTARAKYASINLSLPQFITLARFREWGGRGTRWTLFKILPP
jgi:hypothetical protein